MLTQKDSSHTKRNKFTTEFHIQGPRAVKGKPSEQIILENPQYVKSLPSRAMRKLQKTKRKEEI